MRRQRRSRGPKTADPTTDGERIGLAIDGGIAPTGPIGDIVPTDPIASGPIGHIVPTGRSASGPIGHIVPTGPIVSGPIGHIVPTGRSVPNRMRLVDQLPSPYSSPMGGADSPPHSRGAPHRRKTANTAVTYALWTMLWLTAAPGVGYAGEQWQVGTTSSFSSGRYGTDTRTEILYTPFTVRRLFADGDVTAVLPHTCIRGSGDVTVIDGTPVRIDENRDTREPGTDGDRQTESPTQGRGDRAGAGPEFTRTTDELTTTLGRNALGDDLNTCGMGDIIVRSRYYVLDERGWLPTVAVRAHFKAPTASADDGLGTGRPDEGIGVEVSRAIGAGFTAMVDGGYTLIGKPQGVEFNNRWWYSVGAAKNLANGVVNLSVFLEEYSAIVPGFTNARDVVAGLNLRSARGWRVQLLGEFGLSDGAADLGFIVGASRRF